MPRERRQRDAVPLQAQAARNESAADGAGAEQRELRRERRRGQRRRAPPDRTQRRVLMHRPACARCGGDDAFGAQQRGGQVGVQVVSASMPTDRRSRPSPMPASARASARHRRVGHRRRMRDQAFHAAERFGQGEALQAVEERAHGRPRRHRVRRCSIAPKPRLLARGERMARMRGQAREMHLRAPPDARRAASRSRCAFSWCTRRRASSVRRPRSVRKLSNGEPVRPSAFAHQVSCSCSLRVARDDRAADDVAVAVDVLGRRMHDHVGAELDRLSAAPATGRCCRPPRARRPACAASITKRRSVMRSSGLEGVSIQHQLRAGCASAAVSARGSVRSASDQFEMALRAPAH